MTYAIVGAGKTGTALARVFARQGMAVGVANSRGAASLGSLVEELGPGVTAVSVKEAARAEMVFLAVPFAAYGAVARELGPGAGRIVVDTTNALHVTPAELGGVLSTELVASAFAGSRVVKGFNHLPAAQLGVAEEGRRQAVFLASNDAEASAAVAKVAEQMGFAAVELGRLDEGGVALHVVDGRPGGLLFQNLAKAG